MRYRATRRGMARTSIPLVLILLLSLALTSTAFAQPEDTLEAQTHCPSGKKAVTGIAYYVDGEKVNRLRGNVSPGSTVTVDFTIPKGCVGVEVSLVSYTAPRAYWIDAEAELQKIYDADTDFFDAGTYTLEVVVPDCFFQVDFVIGPPLEVPRFGKALIDADNGGKTVCEEPSETPSPSEPPSEEPSETPSPSEPPSEEPSETPSPSEEPSEEVPSEEPSETPSPSEEPSEPEVPSEEPSEDFGVGGAEPSDTPQPSEDVATASLADTGIPGSVLAASGLLVLLIGASLVVMAGRRSGALR